MGFHESEKKILANSNSSHFVIGRGIGDFWSGANSRPLHLHDFLEVTGFSPSNVNQDDLMSEGKGSYLPFETWPFQSIQSLQSQVRRFS